MLRLGLMRMVGARRRRLRRFADFCVDYRILDAANLLRIHLKADRFKRR